LLPNELVNAKRSPDMRANTREILGYCIVRLPRREALVGRRGGPDSRGSIDEAHSLVTAGRGFRCEANIDRAGRFVKHGFSGRQTRRARIGVHHGANAAARGRESRRERRPEPYGVR
jgi:hypothetical protein